MRKKRNNEHFKKSIQLGLYLLLFLIINPLFSFSEEIRYQSGSRRDPFIPATQSESKATPVTGIQIEGIIFDPNGKSMVVIHGEPYRVGQSIGEQKIVAIYPNKIVVAVKEIETEYWVSTAEQQLNETKKDQEIDHA